MSAAALGRIGKPRLDWRRAGFAAAAIGLNAGAVVLLSVTDPDPRRPSLHAPPMIVYLDETWPTLARASKRPNGHTQGEPPGARREKPNAPPHGSDRDLASEQHPQIAAREDEGIDPGWRVNTAAPRPNAITPSCDAPHRLSFDARRACEDRWVEATNAAVIAGTGDAQRDAAFARQGAHRLAAWENQRAAPTDADEPCLQLGPIVECGGANISVELFSSRDGLLPNLRKRRQ